MHTGTDDPPRKRITMRSRHRPGSTPERTPQEINAQQRLILLAGTLREIREELEELHEKLGEPAGEAEMAEGLRPETLRFSVRAAIECVVVDRLDSAIASLEAAARDTPGSLTREWKRRKKRP